MCVTCPYMKLRIHIVWPHVQYSMHTYIYLNMTCIIMYVCVHFVFLFFSTVLVLVYSTMLNQQPPDGVYSLLDCFARLGAAF